MAKQLYKQWITRKGGIVSVCVAGGLAITTAIWYERAGWYPHAVDEASMYAALAERYMGLRMEGTASNDVSAYPRNWITFPEALIPQSTVTNNAWYLDYRLKEPAEGDTVASALGKIIGDSWWLEVTGTNYPAFLRASPYVNYYAYSQYAMPLSYMRTALLRNGSRRLYPASSAGRVRAWLRSSWPVLTVNPANVTGTIGRAWNVLDGAAWSYDSVALDPDDASMPIGYVDAVVTYDPDTGVRTLILREYSLPYDAYFYAPTNFAGTMTGFLEEIRFGLPAPQPYAGPGNEDTLYELVTFDFINDRDALVDGLNGWGYVASFTNAPAGTIALDYDDLAGMITAQTKLSDSYRVGWGSTGLWAVARYQFQYLTNSAALVIE